MAKKVIRYIVSVTENVTGKRHTLGSEFKTRAEARKLINKILSPAIGNRTRWRDAQSGTGLNNPRIIKRKLMR